LVRAAFPTASASKAPSPPARLLLMQSGGTFAEFVREVSQPADAAVSAPTEADLQKLVAAAENYGLSILGPMPDR
jgi:hypothetical protein